MLFQSLERRRYFTELSISGTGFADDIALTVAGLTKTGLNVRIANNGTRPVTVKVDATAVELAAAATIRTEDIKSGGVTLVRIVDLGGGDDRLMTDPAVNVRMFVSGGRGNDTIATGSRDDQIDGGAGEDILAGGTGRDTISGGDNFDVIEGGTGNDVLYADDATNSHPVTYGYREIEFPDLGSLVLTDQLSGGVGDDWLGANGATVAALPQAGTGLFGDDGNDTLQGDASRAYFYGNAGDDVINGTAGDDLLDGGAGNDSITAGAGNDTLAGGDGSDTLAGGKGDDLYDYHLRATAAEIDRVLEYANGGRDRFQFDALADKRQSVPAGTNQSTAEAARVDLADARNLIRTGLRRVVTDAGLQYYFDDVEGGPQQDTIYGNDGDNRLSGSDPYYLDDTPGDPRFFVIDGADYINGRSGDDTLQSNGPDTVVGGKGNDHFITDVMGNAQSAALSISDIAGRDTQTIEYAVNLIDDSSLGAIGVIDTLRLGEGVENIDLMYGAVGHVIGNDLANVIHVNDDLYYHSFIVAFGTVSGGGGNDTIIGNLHDENDQPKTLESFTGAGATVLEGNDGDDLLIGETDPNDPATRMFLRGGAGSDRLRSTGGPSYLDLSDALRGVNVDLRTGKVAGPDGKTDTFDASISNVRGSVFNDTIVGTDGPNVIYGMAGDDRISGLADNDTLGGGVYRDLGGVPNDLQYLTTRDGNDTLSGGTGTDTADYLTRTNDLRLTVGGKAGGAKGETDSVIGDIETVVSGGGNDSLVASSAGTTFYGSLGADTFVGAAGQDVVRYDDEVHQYKGGVTVTLDNNRDDGLAGESDFVTASIDAVVGTSDDDRLTAGSRPALLDGGTGGSDRLVGGPASDNLVLPGFGSGSVAEGNGGDDVFVNQNGIPDSIDGGDGFDSVQDDDTDGSTPGLQNDSFQNVEYVYDTLAGGSVLTAAAARDDAASADTVLADAIAADAVAGLVVSGVSVAVDRGVLRVNGSSAADVIELAQAKGNVVVYVGKTAAGTFAASTLKAIAISSGAGNDVIHLDTLQIGARVSAGAGNDTVFGGSGNDQLAGEAGNDYVNGGLGNDIVNGDYVVLRGEAVPSAATVPDGSDTVIGGGGSVDIVTYTYRTGGVSIDASGKSASGARNERDAISGVEYVVGGQNADAITGSSANDTIFGGPGNDALRGNEGANRFYAGEGADTVTPNGGSDYIETGPDSVRDDIVGNLGGDGFRPSNANGVLLTGVFNDNDFFTVVKQYYGRPAR